VSSPDVIAATAVDVCELWLDRCYVALDACDTSEPITASYVAAGVVAWDSCCGLLVAAPERVYRSASFPIEGTTDYVCESAFIVVDLVVLLLRCVPTLDDRGVSPAPAALNVSYAAVLADAAVIWNVVVGDLPEGWERANVNQQFVGAQGGCVGVETRLTVGLPQSVWCPECEAP
jgi:hypothetical protein